LDFQFILFFIHFLKPLWDEIKKNHPEVERSARMTR